MSESVRVVFTTERGLEPFLEETLGTATLPSPLSFKGRVKAQFPSQKELLHFLYINPFYHRAFLLLEEGRLCGVREDLDFIYQRTRELSSVLPFGVSFGVKCTRKGKHPYTSQEIASFAGAGVIDGCRVSRGFRPGVNLKNPQFLFVVDVADDFYFIGVELVGLEALHHRGWRVYDHRAALKPTIANALIKLCGWGRMDVLWDPMCGGGTIPIEAAHRCIGLPPAFFRKRDFIFLKSGILDVSLWDEITWSVDQAIDWKKGCRILGSDVSPKYIEGARRNAESALVEQKIVFGVASVERCSFKSLARFMVCNPPYGIRMGGPNKALKAMDALFRAFAEGRADSLSLIYPDVDVVLYLCDRYSLKLDKYLPAYNGNLEVFLFRILKT